MTDKENAAGGNHAAHQETQANDSNNDGERKAENESPAEPTNEVEMVCMSEIEMKSIEWLWPDRIARGKLTLIAGDPGLGKSQLAIKIAAIVTKGMVWPETQEPAPRGDVILISAEDDPADTIKPRLVAAGADITRCHILRSIITKDSSGKNNRRYLDLKRDIERLGTAIAGIDGTIAIVIDPISAYLGDTDSHKNAEVRSLLMALAEMATQYNVAIILLTHLSKEEKKSMIARVMGSIAMIAAARAGYIVTKDDKNPDTRYFLPIKNNIGNDSDGFAFQIENAELPDGIKTSQIVWQAGLVDAHSTLYPKPEEKPTATNSAANFLRELLSRNPMRASSIFNEAEGAGFSKPSIQRAASKLGVRRKKLGMAAGWEWSLPPAAHHYTEGNEGDED